MDGAQVAPTFGADPVDFHVEFVIFAVTRAVSAESKALYSVSLVQPLPYNSSDVKRQPLRRISGGQQPVTKVTPGIVAIFLVEFHMLLHT